MVLRKIQRRDSHEDYIERTGKTETNPAGEHESFERMRVAEVSATRSCIQLHLEWRRFSVSIIMTARHFRFKKLEDPDILK